MNKTKKSNAENLLIYYFRKMSEERKGYLMRIAEGFYTMPPDVPAEIPERQALRRVK